MENEVQVRLKAEKQFNGFVRPLGGLMLLVGIGWLVGVPISLIFAGTNGVLDSSHNYYWVLLLFAPFVIYIGNGLRKRSQKGWFCFKIYLCLFPWMPVIPIMVEEQTDGFPGISMLLIPFGYVLSFLLYLGCRPAFTVDPPNESEDDADAGVD